MLRHRAAAARADGHPGFPRRPARHGDRRRRRAHQCLQLTGRELRDTKLVVNGAGAAAIACVELMKAMGVRPEHVILCDTKGVIYQGRTEGHEPVEIGACRQHQGAHAERGAGGRRRVLRPVGEGAVTKDMVARMADKPIIFAMANPDPEITPEEVARSPPRCDHRHRAQGLSEPGQQRAGLPLHLPRRAGRAGQHHQRGDEDRRGRSAGEAGARGRARRGRQASTAGACAMAANTSSPRLRSAADQRGAAWPWQRRRWIRAWRGGRSSTWTGTRRGFPRGSIPTAGLHQLDFGCACAASRSGWCSPRARKRRWSAPPVAFADLNGYGNPDPDRARGAGAPCVPFERRRTTPTASKSYNARSSEHNKDYAEFLYQRLQRKGFLYRDCVRMVNHDRNVFAACMLATGHADAMVTGRHKKLDDGASRCAARARSEGGAAGHRRIRHHQPRQGYFRCGHFHPRYAHLGGACRHSR